MLNALQGTLPDPGTAAVALLVAAVNPLVPTHAGMQVGREQRPGSGHFVGICGWLREVRPIPKIRVPEVLHMSGGTHDIFLCTLRDSNQVIWPHWELSLESYRSESARLEELRELDVLDRRAHTAVS